MDKVMAANSKGFIRDKKLQCNSQEVKKDERSYGEGGIKEIDVK